MNMLDGGKGMTLLTRIGLYGWFVLTMLAINSGWIG